MKLHTVALTLLIIGGLNWGLEAVGFGIGRLVPEMLATVIYALVGLAAVYEIVNHKNTCKDCVTK